MAGEGLTRRRLLQGGAAAGGAVLLGGGIVALTSGQERDEPKRKPQFDPTVQGLNVVLICLDTLRADHVGAYKRDGIRPNLAVETPSIDALAREGLRFTRARPEVLPTGPTRRSVYTGARVFPMDDWKPDPDSPALYGWQRIPERQTQLDEVLRRAGYRTALITDNTWMLKPSWKRFTDGFDDFVDIQGQEYQRLRPGRSVKKIKIEDYMVPGLRRKDPKKVETHEGVVARYLANQGDRRREDDWSVARVFTQANAWLERHGKGDKPFFLSIDSYDPHEPWDPPKKYVDRYDDPRYRGPEPISPLYGASDYLSKRELARMRALYAGEVTLADHWLGVFLEKLEDLGLAERTVVVLYSDHGHSLGERGYVGKNPNQLYGEMVDVPLIIRHPDRRVAGRTTDFLAQLHDLAPTILSTVGLPVPGEMEGIDLAPLLAGGDPERDREIQTAGYNDYVWASDGRHTMIISNRKLNPKVFDRRDDPRERRNRASDEQDLVDRFWDQVLDDAGGKPPPRYKR